MAGSVEIDFKETEPEQIAIELCALGEEANKDFFERARLARRFIVNKNGDGQWDEADKKNLENQGVTPITVNYCLPIRDNLAGREQRNRKDARVLPVKSGRHTAAKVLSTVTRHAIEDNDGLAKKSDMFQDGVGKGKGWLGIDVSYEKDPIHGDIQIRHWGTFRVSEDPVRPEYDLNSGAMYVNCWDWVAKDKVHAEHPDKVEDLKERGSGSGGWFQTAAALGKSLVSALFNRSGHEEDDSEWLEEGVKPELYNYKVWWTWAVTHKKVTYWVDKEQQQVRRLTEDKDIALAEKSAKLLPERFQLKTAVIKVLHKVKRVADVLLEYKEDPFKYGEGFSYEFDQRGRLNIYEQEAFFPLVPYYAYFEDGYAFGKIENIIGPQRESNKKRTSFLRILNTMAKVPWVYEAGSLDEETEAALEQFGSMPGFHIKYKTGSQAPIQKELGREPSAHFASAMTSREDMKEIANVNTEGLGWDGKSSQSGRALMLQEDKAMLGNEIIFANLDRSHIIFSNTLIAIIRCTGVYSEDEIRALLDDEDLVDKRLLQEAAERLGPPPQAPPPPNPAALEYVAGVNPNMASVVQVMYQKKMAEYEQQARQYQELITALARQMLIDEVHNLKVGRYSTKVAQSAQTPTRRFANFSELLEIDKIRPGHVPFETLIDASDLEDKDKIKEDYQRNRQQMQEMAVQTK